MYITAVDLITFAACISQRVEGSSVISCSPHRMNVDIDPYLRHVKLYADLFKICCKIIPFFLVLQSHTHQLVTLKWISVSYVQEQVFPLCKWFHVLIVHQHPVSFHRTAHQWASRIRKMVGLWSLKVYTQSTLWKMGIIGPGIECLSKCTYHLSDYWLARKRVSTVYLTLMLWGRKL